MNPVQNNFFDKASNLVVAKVLEQLDCQSLKIVYANKIKPFASFIQKRPDVFNQICAKTWRDEGCIKIDVRDPFVGKVNKLIVNPKDTVEQLKQHLCVKFDLPATSITVMRLYYHTENLESHKTLAEEGVESGGTINAYLV